MFKLTIVAFVCFTAVVSAYHIAEDGEGQQYYLLPVQSLHRERRQTKIDVSGSDSGVRVTAGHTGNILDSNGHKLDGGAFVSKQFHPSGPGTIGGQLGYSHTPSGSGLNLGAQHTEHFGTDLSATGTANIWRSRDARLDAVGRYNRHFGGFGGTGRPDWYGGLQFSARF